MSTETLERCDDCIHLVQCASNWYCDKFDIPSSRPITGNPPKCYKFDCKEVLQ